jgi:hypothetical protein
MIPHEQIDEALLRSLPPRQRKLTEDALSVVGAYAKTHGLAWEDIYAMADEALSQPSERVRNAANDEEPLVHALLRPVFDDDVKIVEAAYWLYTHHLTAIFMFTAIAPVDERSESSNLSAQHISLKSELGVKRIMVLHAEMLEKYGITPQVAKQSSRFLKDELTKLCTEQSVSPSSPSR